METGVVIIQEPVITKTSIEEASAGVLLDHSSMEVDKVNHSTVLDDEITSRECTKKVDVAEVVNGSGNKETEEPVCEKGEPIKTASVVEDSKIVKEKASETEKDEKGSIFVHEPEILNPKIVSSDVTLEKEKDNDIARKQEEVSVEKPVLEEDQTETKHTPEQEEHIGSISKVLVDAEPVKVYDDNIEKSFNSAGEEIPIKTDEVKEEKDSITVETSVNGAETEHNGTVSVEEISRNGENIVKETDPEEETATNYELVHDVETTKRVFEAEKDAELKLDAKEEIIKTVIEDPEVVSHEETTGHESKSFKENVEPVEAVQNSEDAEKISSEVTVEKEKVQESLTVIETPTIQGEDIESKASKDTEEHEHVLARDIPQSETLANKAENVETSKVQESTILKTLETKTDETDAEPSLHLKGDKEPEELETVKTVISSDVTSVEEAPEGVPLDHSSLEVDKVNHSTVLDDEITSRDCGNNSIAGEIDVAEVVNGSGNKEIEEPDREKGEAIKTVSVVEDSKVVSETEKDEQDSIFVHEPESINPKIVLSDVTLEKEKEDNITRKQEEVSVEKPVLEEDQTETKYTPEQEEQIEKSLNSAREEIPIKTGEVKDSITVETSVNGTDTEHNATVAVEEISSNSENIVKEAAPEDETATNDELVHEGEKDAEPKLDAIENHETVVVKTVIEDPEIVNHEETTGHESEIFKENAEPVEAIQNSNDAEQISREVTVDREKEEDMTRKTEEVQESLMPTIQGDDIESKVSEDTEEHEHVLERDIPQSETLVTKAETVETPTVQESAILENLETKTGETYAEPSLYLKEDKEQQEEAETVKTVISSDPVQESITAIEPPTIPEESESIVSPEVKEEVEQSSKDTEEESLIPEAEKLETKEDTKPIMELKEDKEQEETKTVKTVISSDEVRPSDESVEIKTKETVQEENTDEKHESLLDVQSTESEKYQDNISETVLVAEEISTLPDVESVEELQKPSIESHSEVLEETSKTVDEKIEEKLEEEVSLHQEVQEKVHLTPLQEESCLPNEQEKEKKLQKEETEKHEPTNEEVANAQQTLVEEKSDEVVQVSSSEEREGETDVGVEKIADVKANEDKQTAEIIQRSLETVETTEPHCSLLSSIEKQEHETVAEAEKIEDEKVKEAEPTGDTKEHEHVLVRDIPQVETPVTEAEAIETSTVQASAILKILETKEDTEPVMDLKEDKEQEETEKVKTVIQDESSEKHQENEPETSKTVDEKIEEKPEEVTQDQEGKEEGSYGLETKEKSLSDPEISELGVKSQEEEESCLPNEQEKEINFQKEQIEKHEPEIEEVLIDQQSYVGKKSDEVIQVSSASPSEEREGGIAEHDAAVPVEEISRNIVSEKAPEVDHQSEKTDEVQETPKVIETPIIKGEDIDSKASKDTEEHEHVLVRDMPQVETLVNEAETKDTSTVQEVEILKPLETKTVEPEVVHSAIGGEVEGQETKEVTEPSLDLKAEKEQEEKETVKTDISSNEVKYSDVKAEEFSEHNSSEIKDESHGREESVEVKTAETVQEESSEKNKILLDDKTKVDQVEVTQTVEEQRCLDLNDPEADINKPSIESPSEVSEETSKTVGENIEEKPTEGVTLHQDSQEEGSYGFETKEETISVEEKIQRSLEPVEIVEPHTSIPSPPEEHSQAEKKEDQKVRDIEPLGDLSEKDLEISETKDLSLPVEESSELVAESEEQKPKQVKETEERKEVGETEVVTIPQETLSEVVDATESHERQEELSKAVETKETTVAQEEQTRDIGASLIEKCSTDQTQLEEQVNKESSKGEQEEISSTEKGETKTKEPEDEHVDSSKKNDNENLIAETKLEESKEKEIEATGEASEANQTPSFVSELEDQIPKQIKEIHEEETKESHTVEEATSDQSLTVETSKADQTSSLVSEVDDQIPKKVEEIHEEEKKEAHKLPAEEILPTEITPREDDQVTPQEGTLTTSENVCVKQEEFGSPEATKLEESKEDKSQEVSETVEAIEATGDHTQAIETSEASQTTSFVSELEDKIPKQVEEIHEEEHKEEAKSYQNLPVETSQEEQTPSLVSEHEVKTSKQVEEIHEEETKAEKLQDEEILPTEIVPRESFSEASMLASKEDDQVQEGKCASDTQEEQHVSADDFTFSKETGEAEHGDETSSTLPVVGILTQLHTTLENERAINDSASLEEKVILEPTEQVQKIGDAETESSGNDLHSKKKESEILEKHLVTSEQVANEKQDTKDAEEANKLQHGENGLAGKYLPIEELKKEEHKEEIKVEDDIKREFEVSVEEKLQEETKEIAEQEEDSALQDSNASIAEKISLQEEHSRDFEISKTVGDGSDQVIESELPVEPPQTEQKEETHETVKEEDQIVDIKEDKKNGEVQDEKIKGVSVTKDKEDVSELGVDYDFVPRDVEKEEAPHSVLVKQNEEENNKVATSEKQTTETPTEAEKESNQEHVETQAISDDTKSNNDRDFPTEQTSKDQREEVTEEKTEVEYVKRELEDAIKHGVSLEEKNNAPENIDLEATKEIYQEEESKQTDTVTAIKEEIKEEQKETTQECFNSVKNTDDTIEKTKPVIREIEKLSSVSNTQDKPKQKDEVPIPKLENLKTTEELEQKDKESENTKDMFSEVKDSEETLKEPARKSLSSLIEKVEGTNKIEDLTTKPDIKEEAKTEEEDENEDEHKDDKTSPDSIVMVEAKDTVSIIKTQHKKGILSGVGSKVKHSISKVKKVLTGKSSHTTKPSSPK
ncbi:hypothetical protein AALP_AA6G331600 [Arabis alpina]|uniref:Uncharacterized protein n=1 Tax=Arabis alpina TaxID=50452 RepID=A0A087GTA1_ARAAL|nr:hypothetical protein AALP_AA6G331600 [Arabis alpina]